MRCTDTPQRADKLQLPQTSRSCYAWLDGAAGTTTDLERASRRVNPSLYSPAGFVTDGLGPILLVGKHSTSKQTLSTDSKLSHYDYV
ncbi:hypothetical protein LSAT2_025181 [Lamellibrachia satsuma]|nr:hypothetical protein LSAT2_025181 [Lamellibrachia satsuma]